MKELENIKEIKRKLNEGKKLNGSETTVLLEALTSLRPIKMKIKPHKDNSYSVIDNTNLPFQLFNGTITECESYINLKDKGCF